MQGLRFLFNVSSDRLNEKWIDLLFGRVRVWTENIRRAISRNWTLQLIGENGLVSAVVNYGSLQNVFCTDVKYLLHAVILHRWLFLSRGMICRHF